MGNCIIHIHNNNVGVVVLCGSFVYILCVVISVHPGYLAFPFHYIRDQSVVYLKFLLVVCFIYLILIFVSIHLGQSIVCVGLFVLTTL